MSDNRLPKMEFHACITGEGGKAAQVVGYLVVLGEACFSVRARLAFSFMGLF